MGTCQCSRNEMLLDAESANDEDEIAHGDASLTRHSETSDPNTDSLLELGCDCGGVEEQQGDGKRRADDYISRKRQSKTQRRLIVEASKPVELNCRTAHPPFMIQAYEAQTVFEVLELRAVEIGLPKTAALWLQIQVSAQIAAEVGQEVGLSFKRSWRDLPHDKTLLEAGLCERADISLFGEEKATAAVVRANKVVRKGFSEAVMEGKVSEVKLVITIYPDRVIEKDQV